MILSRSNRILSAFSFELVFEDDEFIRTNYLGFIGRKMESAPLLIDGSHNNLVNPTNHHFDRLFNVLNIQGYQHYTTTGEISTKEDCFDRAKILIIGVPQTSFYTQKEINDILAFVRDGGSLLVFGRYGGDTLQKTNLNELTSHFGIFFENTLVCSEKNLGTESLPVITSFSRCSINHEIKKIVLPGACSLRVSKDAHGLCQINGKGWIDLY